MADSLLLETGDQLLLETGDQLLLQQQVVLGTMDATLGGLAASITKVTVSGVLAGAFGALTAGLVGGPPPAIPGVMAGGFGSLNGSITGTLIPTIHGVCSAAFGSMSASMIPGSYVQASWRVKLLPSSWSAYLKD